MRTLLTGAALLVFAGCSSEDQTGTQTTSTASQSTTSTYSTYSTPEPHPLVPDEFQWLWDTDGCTTYEGGEGINVYWHAQGEADKDGNLTMTEDWYWFMGAGDWSLDCVDTFDIVGEYDAFDYDMLGCGACEQGYLLTRTLVKSNCNLTSYYTMFGQDDQPKEEVYVAIEMLDTLTAGGIANQYNVMDISHADAYPPDQLTSWIVALNWARGHYFPDDKDDPRGYPATYDWVGEVCVTVS